MLLENPLSIYSIIAVTLQGGDKDVLLYEDMYWNKNALINILHCSFGWDRWDTSEPTDLYELSSHQSSSGIQDLVVVFSGEFTFQRVTLQLPRTLQYSL